VFNGHTDTVPDILGRLGAPIGLAIFTEGNHFPALLGGEVIEPFRAHAETAYSGLALDNIVVVTLHLAAACDRSDAARQRSLSRKPDP
jgi:hypothetical protein